MKLRLISEVRNRMAISDGAKALGDLIDFIRDTGNIDEKKSLDQFLKAPSVTAWDNTKWVIDSASKRAVTDRTLADRIKLWAGLKNLTSLVAVSAVYDIDPKQAKGTPLQRVVLNKSVRDKYKRAMGPQGYISTMSNAGEVPKNRLRDMLKDTAKNNVAITKSIRHDVPGVKPVHRF